MVDRGTRTTDELFRDRVVDPTERQSATQKNNAGRELFPGFDSHQTNNDKGVWGNIGREPFPGFDAHDPLIAREERIAFAQCVSVVRPKMDPTNSHKRGRWVYGPDADCGEPTRDLFQHDEPRPAIPSDYNLTATPPFVFESEAARRPSYAAYTEASVSEREKAYYRRPSTRPQAKLKSLEPSSSSARLAEYSHDVKNVPVPRFGVQRQQQ